MVVATEVAIAGPYNGNDADDTFDYDFYIAADAEIKITLADSDDVETVQTLGVDYTVTGSGDPDSPGGTFIMTTPPATGETVVGTLDIEFKQETNFINLGSFFTETHEEAFDKVTRLCQQNKEEISRCVKVGPTSGVDPDDVVIANLATDAELATLALRCPVLLDSITSASPVASMTVNADLTDHDFCVLEIFDVFPVDASMNMYCQFTDSAGTPFTGANYYNNMHGFGASLSIVATTSGQTEGLICTGWGASPSVYQAYSARLELRDNVPPYNALYGTAAWSIVLNIPTLCNIQVAYLSTIAIGGLKIFCEHSSTRVAGDIARGTMRLWGMPRGA